MPIRFSNTANKSADPANFDPDPTIHIEADPGTDLDPDPGLDQARKVPRNTPIK